jgi:hypothetical protein
MKIAAISVIFCAFLSFYDKSQTAKGKTDTSPNGAKKIKLKYR